MFIGTKPELILDFSPKGIIAAWLEATASFGGACSGVVVFQVDCGEARAVWGRPQDDAEFASLLGPLATLTLPCFV